MISTPFLDARSVAQHLDLPTPGPSTSIELGAIARKSYFGWLEIIISRSRPRDGAYKEPSKRARFKPHRAPIPAEIRGHFRGGMKKVGTYLMQIGSSDTLLWVVDLDDHEGTLGWEELCRRADAVTTQLVKRGLCPARFRSSGGRGIHLWGYWDGPQDAYSVRQLLKGCVQAAGLDVKAGVAEVFPKQDRIEQGACGTCVFWPIERLDEGEWLPSVPVPHLEPSERPTAPAHASDTDLRLLRMALMAIPNGGDGGDEQPYGEGEFGWLTAGMALHSATGGGDEGLELWHEWSEQSGKYNPADLERRWRSFKAGGGITAGTIFHVAEEHGFNRRAAMADLGFEVEDEAPGEEHVERRRSCGGEFEVSTAGVRFIQDDTDQWICSPLHVRAKTRDTKSGEWGRLLEWRDDDDVTHQWPMPMEMLQGDGADVRRELARRGLTIAPGKKARELLSSYLQVWPVKARARCVERLGWHGAVYVTPGESIGQNGELVVFQNAHAIEPAFSVAGTVDEWRDTVGRWAAGNSRLVFALSVAFAGSLAEVAGEESGGFHFRGPSSTGKTTALKAAASVWGSPNTYLRPWRATTNGLEGMAALHNDSLLILDELSQIDPREAGEAAYMLANGQGKTRASRTGAARQNASWRLLYLSAGEESLAALMHRVGRKPNAGQELRLVEIDADAGAGVGIFEVLHDQASPAALALALKDVAAKYHGAVGTAWLRLIVADRAKLAERITAGIRDFVVEVVPVGADGQAERVARRFGLVEMAGELASEYGLTGWEKGEATAAARKCFATWLEAFGGVGKREDRSLFAQVRGFFEAHGASRFASLDGSGVVMETDNGDVVSPDHKRPIHNRVGFVRTGADGGQEFLVLPESFRTELCKGFDPKAAVKTLVAAGWIVPGSDRPTQKPHIPGIGRPRLYVFSSRMWEDDE